MKRVAVIGSTGTIGLNTLRVINESRGAFEAYALAVRTNIDALRVQIKAVRPRRVCVWDEAKAADLKRAVVSRSNVKIYAGHDGLCELIDDPKIDIYVFALSGSEGIYPLLKALEKGKRVAIANKEPLVLAGELVQKTARRYGAEIVPIDSEHSAIFQCLHGERHRDVERVILTASGGPFFRLPKRDFAKITPAQALKHPRWKMGKKITVDSATLMNKTLELIEATVLFNVPSDKIRVVIHPESIIHSMVQYVDGSVLAQLSVPDMKIPIQYALTYPDRMHCRIGRIDFPASGAFHFYEPDMKKFPTLGLGYWAAQERGTLPAVLNAADEVCVDHFLKGRLSFVGIMNTIERVMRRHTVRHDLTYETIMAADRWAREEAERLC